MFTYAVHHCVHACYYGHMTVYMPPSDLAFMLACVCVEALLRLGRRGPRGNRDSIQHHGELPEPEDKFERRREEHTKAVHREI